MGQCGVSAGHTRTYTSNYAQYAAWHTPVVECEFRANTKYREKEKEADTAQQRYIYIFGCELPVTQKIMEFWLRLSVQGR